MLQGKFWLSSIDHGYVNGSDGRLSQGTSISTLVSTGPFEIRYGLVGSCQGNSHLI